MLDVRNLTRRYGDVVAVDDVSFSLNSGEMVGFVGGNGAGKTTTMRMIMGLLAPDGGEVLWDGSPATARERSRFGYMPEERGLYPKQPIIEQLVYLGRLKGLSASDARTEGEQTLESFGLGERLNDKLETLSLGNQQRVQIAAAVIGSPIALILDEPFSGLDPAAVDRMAEILRERATGGVPVLFSSHQLDLVERLCDKLVILANGKVVGQGTREELLSRGPVRFRLVTDNDAAWVRNIEGITVLEVNGNEAIFEPMVDGVQRVLLEEGLRRGEVHELARVRASLAEVYREVTTA